MSAHRTARATRPLLKASLWIVGISLFLVACEQVTGPGSTEPTPKGSTESTRDWTRATSFDLSPVDSGGDYTGIVAPWDGVCTKIEPVFGYDIGRDSRPGAGPTDTLTVDLWVATRCPSKWGRFTEMRIFLDMAHDAWRDSQGVDVVAFHPGSIDTMRRRVILSNAITDDIPIPNSGCLSPPPTKRVAASPVMRIEPVEVCTTGQHPDTLRLRMRFDAPLFNRPGDCGPRPIRLAVELTDVDLNFTLVEHFALTLCSR